MEKGEKMLEPDPPQPLNTPRPLSLSSFTEPHHSASLSPKPVSSPYSRWR